MRKYILSAALISTLSSSALADANLNGVEFFVGGSGFVKIENAIKEGEAKKDDSKGFLNGINLNFGGRYLMEVGSGIYSGLDISFVNPQNFLGMSTEYKFNAADSKISSDGEVYYMKDGKIGDPAVEFDEGDLDALKLSSNIDADTFKKFGLNNIQSFDKSAGEFTLADGTKVTISGEEEAYRKLATEVKAKVETFQETFAVLGELKDINFKDAEVSRAVKAAFVSVPVYYAASINDSFTVYGGAKLGGGYLSIVEKASADNADTYTPATHTATQTVSKEGVAGILGLEIGVKYVISDAFQAGLSLNGNGYYSFGEAKNELSAYDVADKDKKTDLLKDNKVLGFKAADAKEKSNLLADLNVSFNFTINL